MFEYATAPNKQNYYSKIKQIKQVENGVGLKLVLIPHLSEILTASRAHTSQPLSRKRV